MNYGIKGIVVKQQEEKNRRMDQGKACGLGWPQPHTWVHDESLGAKGPA